MTEQPRKVQRALGAMRGEVWSDLQHRRIAKRIDEALSPTPAHAARSWFFVLLGAGLRPRLRWGLAAAGLCALLVVIALRRGHEPMIAAEGSAIGSDGEATSAVFSDGSQVEVARGGHVQIVADRADETRIEVVSGRAEFEVQKRPERPFVTRVRGVEVRVIGTRFSTELDLSRPPGLVRVLVHRGIVEVRPHPGEAPSRVTAGDKLEVPLNPAPSPATVLPTPAAIPPEDTSSTSAPASSATPPSGAAAVAPATAPVDASKLFEAARAARGAGDVERAAKLYSTLLKQFPADERVGIAALELGRLRMDAQRDYRPAAEAFRRAIAAAPNEGVREDAFARLVEVLGAMHDGDSCRKERDGYLRRYPKGVHVSRVERACADR